MKTSPATNLKNNKKYTVVINGRLFKTKKGKFMGFYCNRTFELRDISKVYDEVNLYICNQLGADFEKSDGSYVYLEKMFEANDDETFGSGYTFYEYNLISIAYDYISKYLLKDQRKVIIK